MFSFIECRFADLFVRVPLGLVLCMHIAYMCVHVYTVHSYCHSGASHDMDVHECLTTCVFVAVRT